ncbi:hypothetical protein IQ268_11425 [Oculatella sp. LEGE 06141]|uniref:hypothetical protein n=1 Tax=Oculatella sp. LEGE 06141 TaxID=1828648 RepID=UPI00188117D8|nr:hypothetical protein [Oculatella sp. LEGE 06141]MBE9179171.1 hypothetical protein [Oculatella sp. LEGE 06141]
MASSTSMPHSQSQDEIWGSLKRAIAASSGFQRWQAERLIFNASLGELSLDQLVRTYLRETLETLAY